MYIWPTPNCTDPFQPTPFPPDPLAPQVTMSGDWVPWSAKVPQVEVETHKVSTEQS